MLLSTVHTHEKYKDFCRWKNANAITRIIFKISKLFWWVWSQICTSCCHNMLITIAQHLRYAMEVVKGRILCYLLKLNIKFLEWGKTLKKWGLSFHCLLVLKVVFPINDSMKEKRCYKQKALYYSCGSGDVLSFHTMQYKHVTYCNSLQRGDYYI